MDRLYRPECPEDIPLISPDSSGNYLSTQQRIRACEASPSGRSPQRALGEPPEGRGVQGVSP